MCRSVPVTTGNTFAVIARKNSMSFTYDLVLGASMNVYKKSQLSQGGKLFAEWEKIASPIIQCINIRQRQIYKNLLCWQLMTFRRVHDVYTLPANIFKVLPGSEVFIYSTGNYQHAFVRVTNSRMHNTQQLGA